MKNYRLITILLLAFSLLSNAACLAATTDQITQFGITWTFDAEYEYGRFANGDYWVVGPLNIVDIDPLSVDTGERIINGSMINPSPSSGLTQGYDSGMYGGYNEAGDYDPSLNAARPFGYAVSTTNNLPLIPGTSLVSTISTPDTFGETQLKTAAILTVVDSVPPEGSFRPSYSGGDKTVKFNKSQLDYSLLKRLAPPASAPRLVQQGSDGQSDSIERMFERPWLNHIPTWQAQYHHPADNMPDYYRDMADQAGIAALMLHLDFSDAVKERLLIRLVQLGIDNYGVIQDGGADNFGETSGCKWSIIFAGLMLDDADMRNIGQKSGDYIDIGPYGAGNLPPDYIRFMEDDQTFYVSQLEVDITNSSEYVNDPLNEGRIPYSQEDIGLPEWGMSHAADPWSVVKNWDGLDADGFRITSSAMSWGGFVLAAHIMAAEDLWNHNALFDYQDRYMEVEHNWRTITLFTDEMWDTYRSAYGRAWTRNDPDNVYSQGHYIGEVVMLGDVTGNGDISAYDASLTAQYAIGLIDLTPDQVLRADVTQNSDVSAYDASLIAQYAIGLIDGF